MLVVWSLLRFANQKAFTAQRDAGGRYSHVVINNASYSMCKHLPTNICTSVILFGTQIRTRIVYSVTINTMSERVCPFSHAFCINSDM